MPLEDGRYVDAESLKLKLYGRTTITRDDALLAKLITQTEARCDLVIKPRILLRGDGETTEDCDGEDSDTIVLNQYPIESIDSVKIDPGRTFDGDSLVENQDFTYDEESGLLIKMRGFWPVGRKNVRVVYVGGYEGLPADVEEAVETAVIDAYRRAQRLRVGQEQNTLTASALSGVRSESYDSEFDPKWGLPTRTVQVLEQYRH
jgi:hypothetical protein